MCRAFAYVDMDGSCWNIIIVTYIVIMFISSKFEILYEWVNGSFLYAAANKLKNDSVVYILYFYYI